MDEYLCITLLSHPEEGEPAFKERLSQFWTHMLRNHEREFEKVYAESSSFETKGKQLARKYLVEADVAPMLVEQLQAMALAFEPIDPDDIYSKYEATPPDWFWIEH